MIDTALATGTVDLLVSPAYFESLSTVGFALSGLMNPRA
jgi:hypothetical protein